MPAEQGEPIALIGMGCRFPGDANSPAALWDLLQRGVDAVGEVPPERWNPAVWYSPDPTVPGRLYTQAAGCVKGVDQFDAGFFGIAPREAAEIDPQHRMLLEVTWEALEDAGLIPERLRGSDTGVYVGIYDDEYGEVAKDDPAALNSHSSTGRSRALASNRLSYFFDWHGPSVSVDAACASSLVALHLACEALWRQDVSLALVGGANIILGATTGVGFCKASMLSRRGRCFTFDARCDGYVRAEGLGVVILKPLAQARADRDRVYAVIRATAVNQDGRTPGISHPNQQAQAALVREVLRRARLAPHEIQYVEAHGTGTPVGDPIECAALGEVLSVHRGSAHPCRIGSIKTNLGHLESAAGMGGLIKLALMLHHRTLVPHLHFEQPNPAIDFVGLKLQVQTALEPWPNGSGPRYAGVNSFGFGGTNAHAILHDVPPAPLSQAPVDDRAQLLLLSAQTPPALRELAEAYRKRLNDAAPQVGRIGNPSHAPTAEAPPVGRIGNPSHAPTAEAPPVGRIGNPSHAPTAEAPPVGRIGNPSHAPTAEAPPVGRIGNPSHAPPALADLCFTAARRRAHLEHRLAVTGRSAGELDDHLRAFCAGEQRAAVAVGRCLPGPPPRLAFVYCGNGPQWWGMGRQLLAQEPVFRSAIERCDQAFRGRASWSLLEELAAGPERSRLDRTEIAQPALFAIQYGLTELFGSWGIEPEAIVGHSGGEVAAALAAGAISLEDAVRIVFHRGRALEATYRRGRMAAVGLSAREAEELLAPHAGKVCVAAVNSNRSITLSGDGDILRDLGSQLQARQVFFRMLSLEYPFHSPAMAGAQDELFRALNDLSPSRRPLCRFVSTVTGADLNGADLGAAYWSEGVRKPVLFGPAAQCLIDDGITVFLEIGPHPVLLAYLAELLLATDRRALTIGSLRRQEDERAAVLGAAGRLHVAGVPVRWDRVYPEGRFVDLPTYPWQHERHWLKPPVRKLAQGLDPVHPLLGARVELAQPCWENELDLRVQTYLADHRIGGSSIFPIAGYMEMALAAAQQLHGPAPWQVEALEVHKPLPLEETRPVLVQTLVSPVDHSFDVQSRPRDRSQPWSLQVSGRLGRPLTPRPSAAVDLEAVRSRVPEHISPAMIYCPQGLDFGPQFQTVEWVRLGDGEVLGRIRPPVSGTGSPEAYHLHPAVLDGCLQCLGALSSEMVRRSGQPPAVIVPVSIDRYCYLGGGAGPLYVHGRQVRHSPGQQVLNATVCDEAGTVVAVLEGLHQRLAQLGDATVDEKLLYRVVWVPRPRPEVAGGVRDAHDLLAPGSLVERLSRQAALRPPPAASEKFRAGSDRLTAAFIWRAMRQLWPEGDLLTSDRFLSAGVQAEFVPLLRRWLGHLAADGILRRQDDGWTVLGDPASVLPDPDLLWRQLALELPGYHAELHLMGRCGRHLGEVLRGQTMPQELIFPTNALATAEHLFDSAPTFRAGNALCADALAALVERLPAGRTLRVLELGAGTGGATGWLLRRLPPDRTQYVVTDASEALLAHAQDRFGAYPFVEYRLLDIERDPLASGFAAHDFDVIVAAHVLHATRDRGETLGNVRRLLASEGLLVLTELGCPAPRWLDIVLGLLPDRWRADSPVLPEPAWRSLLGKCGFTDIVTIKASGGSNPPGSCLYLARGPRVERTLASLSVPSLQVNTSGAEACSVPPVDAVQEVQTDWLVFADRSGLGAELAERLRTAGARVTVVTAGPRFARLRPGEVQLDPRDPAGFQELLHQPSGPTLGVIYLWGLDAASAGDFAGIHATCGDALALIQALEQGPAQTRKLWLVTAGAETVPNDRVPTNAGQAPLWGLGRVVRSELSNLVCHLVDVSPCDRTVASGVRHDPGAEVAVLLEELHAPRGEAELVVRGSERFVPRLRPLSLDAPRPFGELQTQEDAVGYCLEIPSRKGLNQLRLRQVPVPTPQPGQVVIEIKAAGLNFRDVLLAMGMIAPDVYESAAESVGLGLECAGVVHAVGPGVSGWQPGDEVFAVTPHAIGRFVAIPAERVMHKPAGMSFAEAATVLSAFLTAYYALKELGRVEPGERVLVHGAAGGVGLAAVQIVRHLGGEVWATAGSPEKRDYLRALGVPHVFDSRSLAFVEEIRTATGGQGIDVVLNSLAGEAMVRSLSLLRPFGRFLELGKRDYLEDRPVSLRPFLHNLAYHSVDLDQLYVRKPALTRRLAGELLDLFARGILFPLPHRVFPIGDVVAAFQHMQRSRHMGKVVIATEPEPELPLLPPRSAAFRIPAEATYLVTGGLGGFGLATASALADAGARHLVLTGRRGLETPGAAEAVADLERRGVHVLAAATDVTDAAAMRDLLTRVRRELPPLRGVVHSAAVLEDASLFNLNRQMMERVLAVKIQGAWNLHQLTRDDPLDHFILFSSIAALVGNPGQGNYAAGNAFLDALARHRRERGLPALAVNWGAIGEVGLVARHRQLDERFARSGVRLLAPKQALRIMEQVLQAGLTHVAVLDLDPGKLALNPAYLLSPLCADLRAPGVREAGAGGTAESFRDVLAAAPDGQRPALIRTRLAQHVARTLGTTVERLDLEKSITQLGLDSLMGVELRMQLERDMAAEVPLMALMQGPSVVQLAQELVARHG